MHPFWKCPRCPSPAKLLPEDVWTTHQRPWNFASSEGTKLGNGELWTVLLRSIVGCCWLLWIPEVNTNGKPEGLQTSGIWCFCNKEDTSQTPRNVETHSTWPDLKECPHFFPQIQSWQRQFFLGNPWDFAPDENVDSLLCCISWAKSSKYPQVIWQLSHRIIQNMFTSIYHIFFLVTWIWLAKQPVLLHLFQLLLIKLMRNYTVWFYHPVTYLTSLF